MKMTKLMNGGIQMKKHFNNNTVVNQPVSASGLITCRYIPEPLLKFSEDGLHDNPKSGIARFGPYSYSTRRHPHVVQIGFIGTAETIEITENWIAANAQGVVGNETNPQFPGFSDDRGFYSKIEFDEAWVEKISQTELNQLLAIKSIREAFEATLSCIDTKIRLLAENDLPPQYLVIALPDKLLKKCRTVEYYDTQQGTVHRDLRRAIKSMAMKYRIPTQLVSQTTVDGRDKTHPSKIAWNFFTGLYFKAGGLPWGPTELQASTCYVGISFYKPTGTKNSRMQSSLAQAFNEHGEGLVLRGPDFEWDAIKQGTNSPHLTEEHAYNLIKMVLGRYRNVMKQYPRRVVVHKTSHYWPDEREGFSAALRQNIEHFDLLSLTNQSVVRLMTKSKYPPLRGTYFSVGDLDFLYTTGYIASLGEFHGMHVPSPLQIADHVGQDSPRDILLKEILVLTKMNWNSAHFGGLQPITLRFSRLVGDVLKEIPEDREPLPQFKFYM